MQAYKFVMVWVRFTLLVATIFFIMGICKDGLPLALGFFVGIIFASALLYCFIVFLLALTFWVWNGNEYIKKNLPSEDVINP